LLPDSSPLGGSPAKMEALGRIKSGSKQH